MHGGLLSAMDAGFGYGLAKWGKGARCGVGALGLIVGEVRVLRLVEIN